MSSSGLIFFILLWFIIILVAIAVPIVIGVLVYQDAKRQEMSSPLAWALVAALSPSLIGLVIYLVVRSSNSQKGE